MRKKQKKQIGEPKVLVTDKAAFIRSAIKKRKNNVYRKAEHQSVNYFNNLVEKVHRPIKHKSKCFRNIRTASITNIGVKTIRKI